MVFFLLKKFNYEKHGKTKEVIIVRENHNIEILDKKREEFIELHPSKEDSKASTHSEPSKKTPPLSHSDHVHEHGTIDRMEEQKGYF